MSNYPTCNRTRGFSLIELTVALLIIVLLSGIALRATNDLSFQVRYEQTQDRLNQIKQAIIGKPQRTLNGLPDISGFVADMGRLPRNIHELLEREYCLDDRTQATAAGCGASWQSMPLWQLNAASGLWHGWHGPYLAVSSNPSRTNALTDGWGREAQGSCSDPSFTTAAACTAPNTWITPLGDHNYGWWYNSTGIAVSLLSYGKNYEAGGADYDGDYPATALVQPLVAAEDWQIPLVQGVNVKNIDINIAKPFGTFSFCGFSSTGSYPSDRNCLNAGGSWSAPNCTINETNCKSVGGQWQSCFLAPVACTAAGGTSAGRCQFTQKSCNSADGNVDADWNTTTNTCDLNNASCTDAGGTWGGTQCNFTKPQCAVAGGTWFDDCAFTAADCTSAGGVPGTVPDSCAFTQAACRAINGQSTGSDCYMSHAEFTGEKYNPESCQASAGLGSAGARTGSICLNVFYRNPATSLLVFASSAQVLIDENGNTATVSFTLSDTSDIDGDANVTEALPWLPAGQNAIGIYEWDGDCDPVNNPLYPAGHTAPIPVYFNPRGQLPAINW